MAARVPHVLRPLQQELQALPLAQPLRAQVAKKAQVQALQQQLLVLEVVVAVLPAQALALVSAQALSQVRQQAQAAQQQPQVQPEQ